jgi:hypothetical protein
MEVQGTHLKVGRAKDRGRSRQGFGVVKTCKVDGHLAEVIMVANFGEQHASG